MTQQLEDQSPASSRSWHTLPLMYVHSRRDKWINCGRYVDIIVDSPRYGAAPQRAKGPVHVIRRGITKMREVRNGIHSAGADRMSARPHVLPDGRGTFDHPASCACSSSCFARNCPQAAAISNPRE